MAELLIVLVVGVVLGIVVLDVLLYRRYVQESLLRQLLVHADRPKSSGVPTDVGTMPEAAASTPQQDDATPEDTYVDAATVSHATSETLSPSVKH